MHANSEDDLAVGIVEEPMVWDLIRDGIDRPTVITFIAIVLALACTFFVWMRWRENRLHRIPPNDVQP